MPVFVLAGIKHSGKSTMGRLLSRQYGYPFKDLDDLIQETIPPGWTIRKWYTEKGRDSFLEKEQQSMYNYMAEWDGQENRLLALGGGTLENPGALEVLKKEKAVIFVLDEEEKILYQRIIKKGLPPFLDADQPEESFHELYTKRRKTLLEEGDHIINIHGLDKNRSAEEVSRIIRSIYGGQ